VEQGGIRVAEIDQREDKMQKNSGKKKEKCKNCEGKGLVKNGDKKVKCQRCGGTGYKP
jgi:DnaJ-class molecular chaperone